jgi:hypothetical protein
MKKRWAYLARPLHPLLPSPSACLRVVGRRKGIEGSNSNNAAVVAALRESKRLVGGRVGVYTPLKASFEAKS